MADFRESFDRHFVLAVSDPDELVEQLPNEVEVFGAQKTIDNYRNPASSDLIQRLGNRLTELWMDLSDEVDLTRERDRPVRAHTSRNDFIVTPRAMMGFHPLPSTDHLEGEGRRLKFLITSGADSISILPDTEPPIAEFKRTRQTSELKRSFFTRPKIVPIPERSHVARLPASDDDVASALRLVMWADPGRNPSFYEKVAS